MYKVSVGFSFFTHATETDFICHLQTMKLSLQSISFRTLYLDSFWVCNSKYKNMFDTFKECPKLTIIWQDWATALIFCSCHIVTAQPKKESGRQTVNFQYWMVRQLAYLLCFLSLTFRSITSRPETLPKMLTMPMIDKSSIHCSSK